MLFLEDTSPFIPTSDHAASVAGDVETKGDTKVVNKPASANAAMLLIASGAVATTTFVTISRRRK